MLCFANKRRERDEIHCCHLPTAILVVNEAWKVALSGLELSFYGDKEWRGLKEENSSNRVKNCNSKSWFEQGFLAAIFLHSYWLKLASHSSHKKVAEMRRERGRKEGKWSSVEGDER